MLTAVSSNGYNEQVYFINYPFKDIKLFMKVQLINKQIRSFELEISKLIYVLQSLDQ